MACVRLIDEAYSIFPTSVGMVLPKEIDDELALAGKECRKLAQNEYVKHIWTELVGILGDLRRVREGNISDLLKEMVELP